MRVEHAITCSYKAEKHKAITPYMRYGIMIGEREHYLLPGRLFHHGNRVCFPKRCTAISASLLAFLRYFSLIAATWSNL